MLCQNKDQESCLDQQSFNLEQCSSIESEDDDQFHKRNYYIKKKKSNKKRIRKSPKKNPYNQSLWNIEENNIYRTFLIQKGHLFDSNRIQRKIIKINVQMSQAIKSRSPDQCRSHHQKMMKHHQNIPNIIEHIEKLLQLNCCPSQNKQSNSQGQTKTQISLKDWSNFEMKSENEESIWDQLIQNSSCKCVDGEEGYKIQLKQ